MDYQLCTTLSCAGEWVRDFQTLIAGILAIGAGALAYRGAMKQASGARAQANATIDAANIGLIEQRRAAAAALWVELVNCRVMLISNAKTLRDERLLAISIPVRRIFTPIFDSNPAAVGHFPSDEAFAAANAYQMVKLLDDSYRMLLECGALLTKEQGERVAQRVDDLIEVISKALHGLRATAGISEAQAQAAIVRYEAARQPSADAA